MNFEKFTENVQADLTKSLSDAFPDVSVEVMEVNKLQGQSYTGLSIMREESAVAPSINLMPFFEMYEDGAVYEDVLQKITDAAVTSLSYSAEIDVDALHNYDQMKEHLTIQIIGAENNAEMLAAIPHQMMEDMAVVYRFSFGEVSGGNASIVVSNRMMEHYGITQEQLHKDALEAAQKNEPVSVKNMDEIIYELSGGFAGSVDNPQSPMWIATNESRFNGASVMAYPDFMDQVSEKLEGSFYILPSSTHEVIMIPDSFGMKAQEMKTMVTDINASEVRPDEKLTDNVYHFDSVARVFEQADDFEKRSEKAHSRKSVLDDLGEKKQVCKVQEPKVRKQPKKESPEL